MIDAVIARARIVVNQTKEILCHVSSIEQADVTDLAEFAQLWLADRYGHPPIGIARMTIYPPVMATSLAFKKYMWKETLFELQFDGQCVSKFFGVPCGPIAYYKLKMGGSPRDYEGYVRLQKHDHIFIAIPDKSG